MVVNFDTIELAFQFVSNGQRYENYAYLCRETGEVFYKSDLGDSDELPDDIDTDPDRYIAIPDKWDLDLGRPLVEAFVARHHPEGGDTVRALFRCLEAARPPSARCHNRCYC